MVSAKFLEGADVHEATLVLHGVSLPVANGITRALMADVETVSFDGAADSGLMIVENTGALHEPMLKDRLGQVPIHMSAAEVDAFRREAFVFELRVKCPVTASGLLDVTSRDISVADEDGKDLGPKVAHRFFPVDAVTGDGVLITQLRRGESLHVKGHAVKASGRKRSCFCPVSQCALVHTTPSGAAVGTDDDEPTSFRITLRSECALTPKELVFRALQSLRARVASVATVNVDGANGADGGANAATGATGADVTASDDRLMVKEVVFESGTKLHEVVFSKGQDSTLGEILQFHMLKIAPAFAGYDIAHNLDERMVFRFDAGGKGAATVYARATKGAIDEITSVMVAL